MAKNKVKVGKIENISGEVNVAGGDIINNIRNFHQRALTAAEEAARARKLESRLLAQGIAVLVQNLSSQASEGAHGNSPYKGLLPYTLSETEIFHGRTKAKKDLLDHIRQSPLTVLHAESGAGKSSLLQAGIAAQLIANGHLVVYLRPHHADPVDFIKRMFLPELTQAPGLVAASLREFLRQVCAVLGARVSLYLLVDQFEEFFQLKKEERRFFLQSLAKCLNDPTLKIHWILAMRKEALSDLAELESFGITQFKNTYRLNRLSRAEARDAILEPAARHGIAFEPGLIEHILDTLTSNDEVRPTHLQLVCSALMNELPDDRALTLAYYIEHEGGTEGILRDYLKRQVETLPAGERILAWKVLRALITADRQRALKSYEELIQELRPGGVTKRQIDTILARLVERRLLFSEPATAEMFELAHDYLVMEIELDPEEQGRKAAQELLNQEVRAYQRHGTLLSAERLAVIEPYRDELYLSVDAQALLSKSQEALETALQKEMAARAKRQRSVATGIAAALLLIMASLVGWAITSRQQNAQLATQRLYAQTLLNQDSIDDRKFLLWAENLQSEDRRRLPEARFGLFANYSPIRQRIVPEPAGWVFTIDISPDGALLATGHQDGVLNLWNTETLQLIQTLNGPDGLVRHIEFGPQGDLLAASFQNDPQASVYVWTLPEGRLLFSIDTEAGWAKSIAFHPEQPLMAIGLHNKLQIEVWNFAEPEKRHLHIPPLYLNGRPASVTFSPEGDMLAAGLIGSPQHTILIWETKDWQGICAFPDSNDEIYFLDFHPTRGLLASAGRDPRVGLWDPRACRSAGFLEGHENKVQSANFSSDGKFLVTAGFDNTVRVWDPLEKRPVGLPLHGHKFVVQNAVFGPHAAVIFSGSLDGSVIVWDLNQTTSLGQKILGNGNALIDLSVDQANEKLLALTADGQLHLMDMINYQIQSIPGTEFTGQPVEKAILSPDGKRLAWLRKGSLYVVELETGTRLTEIALEPGFFVSSMSFALDSSQVVLVGTLNKLIAVDIQNRSTREVFGPEADATIGIRAIAASPDGYLLATGNSVGTITLWDVRSLVPVAGPVSAHGDWITQLVFSPDGRTLASASYDGIILLRDAKTLEQLGSPLKGHKSHVYALAFSPDQSSLISGGDDQALIWWNLDTHMVTGKFNSPDASQVTHLVFSEDNQSILSGSQAGNLYLWNMDPDRLVDYACLVAARNFTQAEWEQFFPTQAYHKTCIQWP